VILPSSAERYLSTTLFTNIKEECEKWPVLWLLCQKKNLCSMCRRFMLFKVWTSLQLNLNITLFQAWTSPEFLLTSPHYC
jgi:hypothetical protein